jgi:hypothetical protein
MKKKYQRIRIFIKYHTFVASLLLVGISHSASAAVFDYITQPLTIGPNSISITTDGVTATATAYHVEFSNNTSTIYGPFSTQFFETDARGFETGLSLLSEQDLGQQRNQNDQVVDVVGFDNRPDIPNRLNPFPSIQFALFKFDTPVDISEVLVDDASNFSREIWVAGGSSEPNLSLDLISAFSEFDIINSPDDTGDGLFAHSFDSLLNISFLAVGTPIHDVVTGPFRSLTPAQEDFFINSITFTVTDETDSVSNPIIKANGSDNVVTINSDDNLKVEIGLDSGSGERTKADWWLVVDTPFGWFSYDLGSGSWVPGVNATYQGALFSFNLAEFLNISGLPGGTYSFYFAVDMLMNGALDLEQLHYDSVEVNVNSWD